MEGYQWSADGKRLLIFTNAQRVWRQDTRGDYWVIDVAGGPPRKLGGACAAPSSLMFAKFSPDGGRIAYVRANNLYVEDAATGAITPLTSDGSHTIINGTFDWVYEEELNLRDGFRWSPDGKRIAYWQLDDSGVGNFLLIDDTDSLYSFTIPVQYPKAGTTNSSARVGVVSATGGATQWIAVPGAPRDFYIARLEWAASSDEVVLQQLDRRQHTLRVMLGDARSGAARTVLTEHDSTWVDVVDDLRWLDAGKRFTWVSERDGWRRLYSVARDGTGIRPLTTGAFDLQNPAAAFGEPFVVGVDSAAGWIYFTASPDAPTQLYLFRSRLDGKGKAERVTPASQPGTHLYNVAPGGQYALHTYSTFTSPPVYEIVRLPSHAVVRTLQDNAPLRARLASLAKGKVQFLRVPARDGTPLDAWVMTPPNFDPAKKYPVLFTVYGEPASQTVIDEWPGGDYLWHLDADAAGIHRREHRQSRHAGAARARVATQHLRRGGRVVERGSGGRCARAREAAAVRGLDARGRVGMERRWIDDAQPHVPLARSLQGGDVGGAGAGRATVRHDLSGALHGAAAGECGRLQARLAASRTRRICAAICSSCTARATTTCTIRERSGSSTRSWRRTARSR